MRFLSARRRHPATKVLMLVLALFVVGAVYAAFAPSEQSSAKGGSSQQVKQGKELFSVSCASCHGINGEGTKDGPSLVGVGAASVDFQVSTGRMPLDDPDRQAKRRPSEFDKSETAALASYVASLGPGPGIPDDAKYSGEGLSPKQVARGGELFRTNCSACHNVSGEGGALPHGRKAPSLRPASHKQLYEAMITGPGQMPRFSDSVMTPQDKKEVITYLKSVQSTPDNGGMNLGGLGPVTEGMTAWAIGIGSLIGFAVWITARGARSR